MRNDDIHKQLDEYKEFMQAQFTLTRANYKAEYDILRLEVDKKLKEQADTFRPMLCVWKNRYIALIAMIIFWFVIAWAAENVNIKRTIEKRFQIEFNEDKQTGQTGNDNPDQEE